MKQFFKDHTGKLSMMRLGFFVLIIGSIAFAFIHPTESAGYLGVIGLALGMKWQQNHSENKSRKS